MTAPNAKKGVRIQKILAQAGVASRRQAEELIRAGKVKVNQKVATLGDQADPQVDRITVEGHKVEFMAKRTTVLLHKPQGIISSVHDPEGRPTVTNLVIIPGKRLFPVGRLDYNAEGAILLTNDGDLSNRLCHPRYAVPRTYLARIRGKLSEDAMERLQKGVILDDGPAHVTALFMAEASGSNSWVKVTVAEGRNRLIRRLFEAVGHPVLRLIRIAIGPITLGDLPRGQHRTLTRSEVTALEQIGRREG